MENTLNSYPLLLRLKPKAEGLEAHVLRLETGDSHVFYQLDALQTFLADYAEQLHLKKRKEPSHDTVDD